MSAWIFFNHAQGDLVALLEWTVGLRKINTHKHELELRKCSELHVQWWEQSTTSNNERAK